MTAAVWRVVCDDGSVREVTAVYAAEVSAWAATGEETTAMGDVVRAINATARRAVMSYAMQEHWPVAEIAPPGALTAEERLAQVTAERDAAIAARDALAGAVREMIAATDDRIMGMADGRRVYDARAALDAALAAAGGAR